MVDATASFDDASDRAATRERTLGEKIVVVLTTTDHKVIGNMYLITSFAFFIFGGILALMIRTELAQPGPQYFDAGPRAKIGAASASAAPYAPDRSSSTARSYSAFSNSIKSVNAV